MLDGALCGGALDGGTLNGGMLVDGALFHRGFTEPRSSPSSLDYHSTPP